MCYYVADNHSNGTMNLSHPMLDHAMNDSSCHHFVAMTQRHGTIDWLEVGGREKNFVTFFVNSKELAPREMNDSSYSDDFFGSQIPRVRNDSVSCRTNLICCLLSW